MAVEMSAMHTMVVTTVDAMRAENLQVTIRPVKIVMTCTFQQKNACVSQLAVKRWSVLR